MKLYFKIDNQRGKISEVNVDGIESVEDLSRAFDMCEDNFLTEEFFKRNEIPLNNRKL